MTEKEFVDLKISWLINNDRADLIESFLKYISIQKLSKKGLELLAPTVTCLAEMEGLEAHKRSVTIRLDTNNE